MENGFRTCECRWFFEGELEDDVVDWFRKAKPWQQSGDLRSLEWPEAARVDRYVVIPKNRDIGIKWRGEAVEGRGEPLEFKAKVASLGVQAFVPGVTGIIERWIKWTFDGEALQASRLLNVEKKRIVRMVQLDGSIGELEVPSVGSGSYVKRGLQIELTRLSLAGERFWTLGFEGFPDSSDLREAFFSNVSVFLRDSAEAHGLSSERSFSYPEWIARC